MKLRASLIFALCVCLGIALLTSGGKVRAQDAFKDVPSGNWAYRAVSDFQKNDILVGYPDGFFNGKRVLTRYEFALAIKRMIEHVIPDLVAPAGKGTAPDRISLAPQLSPGSGSGLQETCG